MNDLKSYLTGIAIGIKYRNNFSIEDYTGSIIDELLYRKNSLFNSVNFPFTSGIGSSQKTLHNPQTGDSLILNKSNIILDMNFSDIIPKDKSQKLIEEYFETVTNRIYKIVDIHDIYLIGIVHKYTIADQKNANALYNNFRKLTFDDATSITVNFSKKNVLAESKVKKDINDYENIICTINITQEKKNEYFFQVDYQHVFSPVLESVIDISYKPFIEKVDRYNREVVSKWIEDNEKK
jgi:hypothetical protein